MDPIVVGSGLTASALVILTVQAAKTLRLSDYYAPWAAFIATLFWVGVSLWVTQSYARQDLAGAAVEIVVVFLVATGGYHFGKNIGTHTGIVDETPKQQ